MTAHERRVTAHECRVSAHERQSFHFKKIPGGLSINIFWWKSAWCFLLHKRTNTEKQIRNLSFSKLLFWTPEKACFWFLKKNPQTIFFFVFWLWFSFKNNRRTNVLLVGIFENTLKESYLPSKTPFWLFWAVMNFFLVHWKKYWPKQLLCVYCF